MNYSDVIDHPARYAFAIPTVGRPTLPSPITGRSFSQDERRVAFATHVHEIERLMANGADAANAFPAFEEAGPRAKIFHDPAWARAAILTAGGLCPGLNDVIKGIVETLRFAYGVRHVFGLRYGYRGLNPVYGLSPILLDPDVVDTIHEDGGSILGSSRGNQDVGVMADTLQRLNINMLFCVGGDGTLRGATQLAAELTRRKQPICVIGIPKTVDNDLSFVGKTFGFETAVAACHDIITSAHMEAKGAFNGIGLIKLMGRDSGFIAAHATLSNPVVNYCLIPEVDFELEGEHGLLSKIARRLQAGKGHAVVVVAEGAGQKFFSGLPETRDASGNVKKHDIGELLRNAIPEYLVSNGIECNVRYFDPSYLIRSVPTRGNDAIFCYLLAENAVHAAMAGKTDMVIGQWGSHYTHVPISLAVMSRQQIDPEGSLWQAVLSATRQNHDAF
ncbi:MAG: ATP-dependent 6-phosphofructokinase [Myxococcales bacterium]|jgi:6-phosphofructokinase 1|nr:ATP-dependent 6-phosphofructokinase [Myxococcales bacterium]